MCRLHEPFASLGLVLDAEAAWSDILTPQASCAAFLLGKIPKPGGLLQLRQLCFSPVLFSPNGFEARSASLRLIRASRDKQFHDSVLTWNFIATVLMLMGYHPTLWEQHLSEDWRTLVAEHPEAMDSVTTASSAGGSYTPSVSLEEETRKTLRQSVDTCDNLDLDSATDDISSSGDDDSGSESEDLDAMFEALKNDESEAEEGGSPVVCLPVTSILDWLTRCGLCSEKTAGGELPKVQSPWDGLRMAATGRMQASTDQSDSPCPRPGNHDLSTFTLFLEVVRSCLQEGYGSWHELVLA